MRSVKKAAKKAAKKTAAKKTAAKAGDDTGADTASDEPDETQLDDADRWLALGVEVDQAFERDQQGHVADHRSRRGTEPPRVRNDVAAQHL